MFTSRRLPGTVVLTAVLVAGSACGQVRSPDGGQGVQPGGPAPAISTTTPAPTPTPTTTLSPVPAPTPTATATPTARRSAATGLAGFFAAVGADDAKIKAAARAVNQDVGRTTVRFRQETLELVEKSFPTRSARAIPAGLPASLTRAVFLVYSDLVARDSAFNYIEFYGDTKPRPVTDHEVRAWLAPLAAGSTVARRFPADLAALRSLAASSPPFTLAAPSSRAAAEVLLRIQWVAIANGGCGTAGVHISPNLIPITWKREGTGTMAWDGRIGEYHVPFTARYSPSQGWKIMINAC